MRRPDRPGGGGGAAAPRPELVVLVGLPGSGKSTFARRLASTHRLVSPDALRAPGRPAGVTPASLVRSALAAGESVVLDSVNATRAARAPWVRLAREAGARVVAYHLDVPKATCLARNRGRTGGARVPDVAIHVAAARLTPPARDEGFDEVRVLAPA